MRIEAEFIGSACRGSTVFYLMHRDPARPGLSREAIILIWDLAFRRLKNNCVESGYLPRGADPSGLSFGGSGEGRMIACGSAGGQHCRGR